MAPPNSSTVVVVAVNLKYNGSIITGKMIITFEQLPKITYKKRILLI